MKYTNTIFKKNVVNEEYVPLLIKAPMQTENASYVIYRYGDNSLLEITFDEKDFNVYRINMVICKEFHRINSCYVLPENFTKGDVAIDDAKEVITNKFECVIYDDAISVIVNDAQIEERIMSDNIIWELDASGNLVSLTVYNQSAEIIEHTFEELSYDAKSSIEYMCTAEN